tara:strand:+ start:1013 stop:1414 length:402 start_codon:yes stop_codon:yes gene_type:complete
MKENISKIEDITFEIKEKNENMLDSNLYQDESIKLALKDLCTQIKILDHHVQSNEKSIGSLTKAHNNLRSYVVGAIEGEDNSKSLKDEKKTSITIKVSKKIMKFCENHGPMIAYTFLLSGLVSSLTYFVITKM